MSAVHAAIAAIGLAMYPVGSIYLSVNSTNPGSIFGGTWQRLPNGVFIRNAGGNAGTVGQTQAEGLPNLYGTFGNLDNAKERTAVSGGLFTLGSPGESDWTGSTQKRREYEQVIFNAHSYNSIFGNSSHVTPYNFCVYMWRRTA